MILHDFSHLEGACFKAITVKVLKDLILDFIRIND